MYEKTASELALDVRGIIPPPGPFDTYTKWIGAQMALNELEVRAQSASPQLPPAESCAHAVARFREALLLLTKRHEVEVEVGHIESGVCGGGIEDMPDEPEESVREARAWDAIEKWQDRALSGAVRGAEVRKLRRLDAGRHKPYRVVLDDRVSSVSTTNGVRTQTNVSKPFSGDTRLDALEAAATWCGWQP